MIMCHPEWSCNWFGFALWSSVWSCLPLCNPAVLGQACRVSYVQVLACMIWNGPIVFGWSGFMFICSFVNLSGLV